MYKPEKQQRQPLKVINNVVGTKHAIAALKHKHARQKKHARNRTKCCTKQEGLESTRIFECRYHLWKAFGRMHQRRLLLVVFGVLGTKKVNRNQI
jgi:hypothetical protein